MIQGQQQVRGSIVINFLVFFKAYFSPTLLSFDRSNIIWSFTTLQKWWRTTKEIFFWRWPIKLDSTRAILHCTCTFCTIGIIVTPAHIESCTYHSICWCIKALGFKIVIYCRFYIIKNSFFFSCNYKPKTQ